MNTLLAALLLAATAREDQILFQGNVQGAQTVAPAGTDSVRAEYSYNDRGRGDHIIATWKLNAAGLPIEYSGSGNDYMKAAVAETFSLASGTAKWHSRAEQGEKVVKGDSFYVPANAPPEFTAVLARAADARIDRGRILRIDRQEVQHLLGAHALAGPDR